MPDRMPAVPLAIAALAVATGGLVSLGVARNPAGLIAAAMLIGLGTALLTPSIFALVFARAPTQLRGSAAGTASIFIDLGLSGGPVLVGLLAAAASVPTAFLASALLPVAGALVLATNARRGVQSPGPPPTDSVDVTPAARGCLSRASTHQARSRCPPSKSVKTSTSWLGGPCRDPRTTSVGTRQLHVLGRAEALRHRLRNFLGPWRDPRTGSHANPSLRG